MDTTTQTTEATAPVVAAPVAKATRPAAKPARKAKAAPAKPAAKAKAKQSIPEGMTRSRGALIPKATGKCAFTGAKGQCGNPGRWTVQPENALSCTTHKQAAKRTLFAPPAKRARTRKAQPVAAA